MIRGRASGALDALRRDHRAATLAAVARANGPRPMHLPGSTPSASSTPSPTTPGGRRRIWWGGVALAKSLPIIATRLRDHRNGYNVIDIKGGKVDVAMREWSG